MSNFRVENSFLILWGNFFGLPMTIPDSLRPSKWFSLFIDIWTKVPVTVLPLYILIDIRALIFEDMPVLVRFATLRKVFVIGGFFLKNVIFRLNKRKIEGLIDLWDGSFLESFYPEKDLINRQKNQKENKRIMLASIMLAEAAAISYAISEYFLKQKKYFRNGEMIDPSRSLEFKIVVLFNTCACLSCVSAPAFDSVLVVFLSQVRAKLEFLQERLADIINEIVIEGDGRLLGKRTGPQEDGEERQYEERDPRSVEFVRNMQNVDTKLKTWIHHHQKAISFFEETKRVYSSIAAFQLGYIVIYTSLTALHIIQVKLSLVALGIALVASSNLTSLFLWCMIAGDLGYIDSFGEAFDRAWFLFPRKIKVAFCFIIMRSKKPLTLYGFSVFAITLVTFCEILKVTYQFSAFMLHVAAA